MSDEAPLARDAQTDCGVSDLLGQALARENMAAAWKRVKANKGSAGVDGRTVQETGEYLQQAWPEIRARLMDGSYVAGWKAYFWLAQTPKVMRELDEWLRSVQLKQWRRGTTMYRELRGLGASPVLAARIAANARRWWRNSCMSLNNVLPIAYFDRLGVPRLS